VDCKKNCAAKIAEVLAPVREKRAYYEAHLDEVKDMLADGERRARAVAQETMQQVRAAMTIG